MRERSLALVAEDLDRSAHGADFIAAPAVGNLNLGVAFRETPHDTGKPADRTRDRKREDGCDHGPDGQNGDNGGGNHPETRFTALGGGVGTCIGQIDNLLTYVGRDRAEASNFVADCLAAFQKCPEGLAVGLDIGGDLGGQLGNRRELGDGRHEISRDATKFGDLAEHRSGIHGVGAGHQFKGGRFHAHGLLGKQRGVRGHEIDVDERQLAGPHVLLHLGDGTVGRLLYLARQQDEVGQAGIDPLAELNLLAEGLRHGKLVEIAADRARVFGEKLRIVRVDAIDPRPGKFPCAECKLIGLGQRGLENAGFRRAL